MYAKLKQIDYTPRKLRLVANQVKGMKAEESLEYLKNVNKKGANPVYQTIKSAISNAQNKGANPAELVIDEIRVDQSIVIKRYFAISRGRSNEKLKRYSTLVVKLK